MLRKTIVVTSGDLDGIGLEVTAKALAKLGPKKGFQFVVFYNSKMSLGFERLLSRSFHLVVCSDLEAGIDFFSWNQRSKKFKNPLVLVDSDSSPALWIEEVAQACLKGRVHGLVTAPLSKPEIRRSGLKDLGHTDILKRVCKSKSAYMAFLGSNFNVVLASGHLPIHKVSNQLTTKVIKDVIQLTLDARKWLKPSQRSKPVGLLGLNPHAGDQGLIGNFDDRLLKKEIQKNGANQKLLVGPLVPDAAFTKKIWDQFSFYIAMYHDQGLIPFKMLHGNGGGAHVTLGLPIVRTSVDHGTAKDIYGKNRANPGSMIDAIEWALRLVQRG